MHTALIIDDDSDLSFLLSEVFRSENIETLIAHSLFEAKQLTERKLPTIVVLDNRLPDGNGIDFLPYLKDLKKELEIIFITGDYDSNFDEYSLPEISHFLQKPFSIGAFKNILKNIIPH